MPIILDKTSGVAKTNATHMVMAYQQIGKEIPPGNALIEQLPVEVESVWLENPLREIMQYYESSAARLRHVRRSVTLGQNIRV